MTPSLNVLGLLLLLSDSLVSAQHVPRSYHPGRSSSSGVVAGSPTSTDSESLPCFPSANFQMPSSVPSSTHNWWCAEDTEYAFLGFSYEVTACASILSPKTLELMEIQANLQASSRATSLT